MNEYVVESIYSLQSWVNNDVLISDYRYQSIVRFTQKKNMYEIKLFSTKNDRAQ